MEGRTDFPRCLNSDELWALSSRRGGMMMEAEGEEEGRTSEQGETMRKEEDCLHFLCKDGCEWLLDGLRS